MVITAPTGSGKTLCFVLPILNALRFVTEENEPTTKVFALIIVPVQNLAQQIFQVKFFYNFFNRFIRNLKNSMFFMAKSNYSMRQKTRMTMKMTKNPKTQRIL